MLGECCIRQTGLEKDTTTYGIELRKYRKLVDNKTQDNQKLQKIYSNTVQQVDLLMIGLTSCQGELKHQRRITGQYRIGIFVFTPIAFVGGIYIGYRLSR